MRPGQHTNIETGGTRITRTSGNGCTNPRSQFLIVAEILDGINRNKKGYANDRMLCKHNTLLAHRDTSKPNNSQNRRIRIRDACAIGPPWPSSSYSSVDLAAAEGDQSVRNDEWWRDARESRAYARQKPYKPFQTVQRLSRRHHAISTRSGPDFEKSHLIPPCPTRSENLVVRI